MSTDRRSVRSVLFEIAVIGLAGASGVAGSAITGIQPTWLTVALCALPSAVILVGLGVVSIIRFVSPEQDF